MANLDEKFIAREARVLAYTQAILATYRTADADTVAEGKAWYPRVKQTIRDLVHVHLGRATNTADYQAFSALSPRISFNENLEGFEAYLRAIAANSDTPPIVAGVESNRNKAWSYLNAGNLERPFIDFKGAPKTARFAANLEGNLDYVTVDVWAARAAGIEPTNGIKGNQYLEIEDAYKAVAHITGFKPAELQAITWIATRGKAN